MQQSSRDSDCHLTELSLKYICDICGICVTYDVCVTYD